MIFEPFGNRRIPGRDRAASPEDDAKQVDRRLDDRLRSIEEKVDLLYDRERQRQAAEERHLERVRDQFVETEK